MKRTYVIGGIVAAAVIAGGGAATGVALAGSAGTAGPAYGAPAAAPGASGPAGVGTAALKPGNALVDGAGRALYLFEADDGTTSNCSGQCAQLWPPLLVGGTAPMPSGGVQGALLGTTTRADGAKQVTYNGHPLYYYAADQKPGDTTGEGVNQFGASWDVLSTAGNGIDKDE
jgi:predicted lipoprotein with Yx(FWY)xxD motif